jgi:CspA family cold shock protein
MPLRRLNDAAFRCRIVAARSLMTEGIDDGRGLRRKGAMISIISRQIRPLFALPSLPQLAYSHRPGIAVRGDRRLVLICIPRRRRMAKGTVKWFNPTKGYGFIQPASGGKDIFVHISAVQKAGLTTLNEGQTIEYEEIANRGRSSAENLKV